MTNDELGRALAGLAAELSFPEPSTDLAALAVARIRRGELVSRDTRERSRPWTPVRRATRWVAGLVPPARGLRRALVLALLIVVGAAAVAGATYVGVRGIQIVFRQAPSPSASGPGPTSPAPSPTLPSLADRLELGRQTTLERARTAVSFPVALPPRVRDLATPLVFLSDEPFGGRVSFVWTTPGTAGAGPTPTLLLTEFQARPYRPFIEKLAFGGTRVTDVQVDGARGYWISGAAHELTYIDPDRLPYQDKTRLAGDTLIWTRGSVTLRLEGAPSLRAALAIARATR